MAHKIPMPDGTTELITDQAAFDRIWQRVSSHTVTYDPTCQSVAPSVSNPNPSDIQRADLKDMIQAAWVRWQYFRVLSARLPGPAGRKLSGVGAAERRHMGRLSTAYFLISGVEYRPNARRPSPPPSPREALRNAFLGAQEARATYHVAAETACAPWLGQILLELADEETTHAQTLYEILASIS